MLNTVVNGFSVSLDGDSILSHPSHPQKPSMSSTPPRLPSQPNMHSKIPPTSLSSLHPYNIASGGVEIVSSSVMDQTGSSNVSSREFSETSSELLGTRAYSQRVLASQYFNASSAAPQTGSHLGVNTFLASQNGNSPIHGLSRQASPHLLQTRNSSLFSPQSSLNSGMSPLHNNAIPSGAFLSINSAPTTLSPGSMHTANIQQGLSQHQQQQSSNNAESRSTTNLFVRRLSADVTEDELKELFTPYGTVINFVLMRNIHTGRSMRKAFVRFSKPEEAQHAMQALNDMKLKGEAISIQWANRQHDTTPAGEERSKIRKVFIRNIPQTVTKEEIEELCRQFGEVSAVSIHPDTVDVQQASNSQQASHAQQHQQSADSLGASPFNNLLRDASDSKLGNPGPVPGTIERKNIAFVLYERDGSAQEAVAKLHNTHPFPDIDDGIPLMVKLSEAKKQRMERKKQATTSSSPSAAVSTSMSSGAANLAGWSSEDPFHHSPLQQQFLRSTSETVTAAGVMAASTNSMYASYSGSATPHSSPSPLPGLQCTAHSPGSQRSSSSQRVASHYSTASQQQQQQQQQVPVATFTGGVAGGTFLANFYDPLSQPQSMLSPAMAPASTAPGVDEDNSLPQGPDDVPSPLFVDSRNVSFARSTSPPYQQFPNTLYPTTAASAGSGTLPALMGMPNGFECVCIDPSGVVTTISGGGRVGPASVAEQMVALSSMLPPGAGEAAAYPAVSTAMGGEGESAAMSQPPSFVPSFFPTVNSSPASTIVHRQASDAAEVKVDGASSYKKHGDEPHMQGQATYETMASMESFYTTVAASFADVQTDFEAASPLHADFVDPVSGSDNDNEDNWDHLNSQQLAALVD